MNDDETIRYVTSGPRLPVNASIRVRSITKSPGTDRGSPALDDEITLLARGWQSYVRATGEPARGVRYDVPKTCTRTIDDVNETKFFCAALESAVMSMDVGDRCGVVAPFGGTPFADDPFAFDRDELYVEYDIELIDVVRRARDFAPKPGCGYAKCVSYVETKKLEANSLFARKEYARAQRRYEQGAECLEMIRMSDSSLSAQEMKEIKTTMAVLKSNAAACALNLGDFSACVAACDAALDLDAANAKAMFRKAQALENLGAVERAHDVLRECVELSGDRAIREALVRTREKVAEARKAERAVYLRMLDGDAMERMEAKERRMANARAKESEAKEDVRVVAKESKEKASDGQSWTRRWAAACRERPAVVVAAAAVSVVVVAAVVARARNERAK